MKLVYIVAAVAMLAMLIPAMALPVSAQGDPALEIYMDDPTVPGVAYDILDGGHDLYGTTVRVVPVNLDGAEVTAWSVTLNSPAQIIGSALGAEGEAFALVQGGDGETTITAELSEGGPIYADKKWAQYEFTEITPPQSIQSTWNESAKEWQATASVSDYGQGDFRNKDGVPVPDGPFGIQGAILNWFLVAGNVSVDLTPGVAEDLLAYVASLTPAYFTTFTGDGTNVTTITDAAGNSTVNLTNIAEELVQVVIVPQYLDDSLEVAVTPEITSVYFYTTSFEKVPQVRWAGEKIVLEKNFGGPNSPYVGNLARFSLENQSPGALEGFGPSPSEIGLNLTNTNDSVWTIVDHNGFASCMLVCEDMGEVDVDLALYEDDEQTIANQHGFVVYYLKFENLYLRNVDGKRAGHDEGLWIPENPWDTTNDVAFDELNVSQDTLLRAKVKGWFTNANPSVRIAEELDMDQDGTTDLLLPAGRWVLPDDWAALAGPGYNRIHWDIMDNPYDGVRSSSPFGPYILPYPAGVVVAESPVIGPFQPGIELMTNEGWAPAVQGWDDSETLDDVLPTFANREIKTVVPNGEIESWDAPMPPALVTFEIIDTGLDFTNVGYFKAADKTEIYYSGDSYTNPFYSICVPAHWAIPAFINNGGYEWDTFGVSTTQGTEFGYYPFWQFLTTSAGQVATADFQYHPTKVDVYSDNHGEAMVFLNGDWNLDFAYNSFITNGAADVQLNETIGFTTVQAMVDYPYLRKHQAIVSEPVTKEWWWGGLVLGTDANSHNFPGLQEDFSGIGSTMVLAVGSYTPDPLNPDNGMSNKLMAWVWATDRDGKIDGVLNAKVEWEISAANGSAPQISTFTTEQEEDPLQELGVSEFNRIMQSIDVTDGFLDGTFGVASPGRTSGVSYMRAPDSYEQQLFNKFWGAGGQYEVLDRNGQNMSASNFAVAAIEVINTNHPAATDATVQAQIESPDYGVIFGTTGKVTYYTNIDYGAYYPLDDPIVFGDANANGVVEMGDVTAIERMILGLDNYYIGADANANNKINMGDVVKIERMLLEN